MFELSTIGILVSLFIVLNVVSTVVILSACIVSGRAAREVDPQTEAAIFRERELALAISKLRIIDPDAKIVPNIGRSILLTSEEHTKQVDERRTPTKRDPAIAASRA